MTDRARSAHLSLPAALRTPAWRTAGAAVLVFAIALVSAQLAAVVVLAALTFGLLQLWLRTQSRRAGWSRSASAAFKAVVLGLTAIFGLSTAYGALVTVGVVHAAPASAPASAPSPAARATVRETATASPSPAATPSPSPSPTAPAPSEPTGLAPDGPTTTARVVDVVDGDTIKVEIDGKRYTLRYIGIDTPETVDPRQPVQWMGPEASAANEELVAGQTVQLEKDVSEVDRYGRLLRYVWLQRDGAWLMVNYELVRRGFAHASSYPPDVHYQDLLRQAEAEARTDGIGLWSASPTAEPTAAGDGPTVCDGEMNAPGNDNLPANLNGEYVVICNATGAAVALGGWHLQDEGPHHSYTFPAFTLRAGARVTVHSGAGRNTATDLYWNSDGAVWNNDGDCASLVNAAGTLMNRRCF